jgi:hypothetical protein
MAIDLKKMRQKLTDLKNKGSGGRFWKPQDGKQDIRIVPTEDGDPFKSFFFHYNVGNQGFLCPEKNYGDECPVCNFARQLYKEGDDESIAMAKDLTARQRFLSPVLVRGEDGQGVKIWSYSKTVYEELLNLVLNPDYGDVTDVDNGFDLTLEYGKAAGARFPSTKITPRRKTSPLCADKTEEECTELLESIPDFDTLYDRVSTEEAQRKLDEHLAADPEDDSNETGKYGGESSVDKAFADLSGS